MNKQKLTTFTLFLTIILLGVAGFLLLRNNRSSSKNEAGQDLSQGILALNTDKSQYLPKEKVTVGIASLDNTGHTLCNGNLKLEIIDPQNKTEELKIINSPTCGDDNATNDPDWLATQTLEELGQYKLKLTNQDTGKTTETEVKVISSLPFDIKRSGATRVNPFKSDRYPMVLTVTANSDYKGIIEEQVPSFVEIIWQGPASVKDSDKQAGKTLTWDVDLKAGEAKTLSYEYQTPQSSPDLIKLGPALIIDSTGASVFQESRQWQIVINKKETP